MVRTPKERSVTQLEKCIPTKELNDTLDVCDVRDILMN